MPFKPAIQLLKVPRTQDYFTVKDVTGTYPATSGGYGTPGAPASLSAITSVWTALQNYGDQIIVPATQSGTLLNGYTGTTPVKTGVNTIIVWYGERINANWTLAVGRKTITFSPEVDVALLDAVGGVSPNGEYPAAVLTATSSTITLETPLPGTATSGTTIYRYYAATLIILVQYQGEQSIARAVVNLPLNEDYRSGGQLVMEQVLLKTAADIEFACGKWSRAHEAACLAAGIIPISISQNYPTNEY